MSQSAASTATNAPKPTKTQDPKAIKVFAFGVPLTQDVTVVLKKYPATQFLVSKAVLSAFSEVLFSMFNNKIFAEREENTVQLDFKRVKTEDFNFFLEWVYSIREFSSLREFDTEHRFLALAEIANMYDVKTLKEKLTEFDVMRALPWTGMDRKEILYTVASEFSPKFGKKVHDFLFDVFDFSSMKKSYKKNERVDYLEEDNGLKRWKQGTIGSVPTDTYQVIDGYHRNYVSVRREDIAPYGSRTQKSA